nr:hypothetical protein [Tanacetum cinerariifolium]
MRKPGTGVVKPKIEGNVNFEIKSQFIVSQDAVLLHVFSFTLTGSAKRWVDRLIPGAVNTWDLLKKAFIQRYCPPSKTAKQLEYIHNFKRESDESLYQAWKRYNDLLYKCPTHDINSHQKVNFFYKGLNIMNLQLLDSRGLIPEMTPTQALTAIQTMVDHSQKWHDETSSRNVSSNNNTDGLTAIISKLDDLGRDMKKMKEDVHAIQVINCFEEALDLDKDPMERSFDDCKWMFDLEIGHLADEYELGIGKKGHILDMIWENYHGFVRYPFDYRVTLGFVSITGGLDHVNPVIRFPLEHGISRVLGKDDYSNPSVGTNPVIASIKHRNSFREG